MTAPDPAAFAAWAGRTEERAELIADRTAQLLAATLDHETTPGPGEAPPPAGGRKKTRRVRMGAFAIAAGRPAGMVGAP